MDKPIDGYINSIDEFVNLTFNATVTDNFQLSNCSLWHNYTGAWHLNQTQEVTGIDNVTEFNVVDLTDKTYFIRFNKGKYVFITNKKISRKKSC